MGEFITKRPHKKSRGGCQICKTKKVKCDELQPKCSFCEKRNLPCIYPPKTTRSTPSSPLSSSSLVDTTREPTPLCDPGTADIKISWDLVRSPSPLVMSSAGALSPIDIRMMHQWSTMTSLAVGVGDGAKRTLQLAVPKLAFENDYVMNAILGIASLHEQSLAPNPEQARRQTDIYRAKALSGFRQALPGIVPFTREYEAALIMSILLVVLCSRDYALGDGELTVVNWVILYRGLSAVITMISYERVVTELSVSPIFRRQLTELKVTPAVPNVLMDMVRSITVNDPDFEMLEEYCKILDALGLLYGSLQQDGLGDALYIRVITWPSFSSQGFANCATEYRPRALVILSYYLMFVKLVKPLWWMQGIADREIGRIARMVGPKWLQFMMIPMEACLMTEQEQIAKFMLI